MPHTAPAKILVAIARAVGAVDDAPGCMPSTDKMARLRWPNGRPFAIQMCDKTPSVWMLAEHEGGVLKHLGRPKSYPIGKSRNSNLLQIKEFRNLPEMVQVRITSSDTSAIQTAFEAIGHPA